MYLRLAPHNSLTANQIGDETILRNIVKMTAPCWTRCLYRYPPLVNQTWHYQRFLMLDDIDDELIPDSLPKKNGEKMLGLETILSKLALFVVKMILVKIKLDILNIFTSIVPPSFWLKPEIIVIKR
jgi:hypothetical protein